MEDIKLLDQFYNQLQDEESRNLFDLRWGMFCGNKSGMDFLHYINNANYHWDISDYDDFRKCAGDKEIIIFGAGTDGESTYRLLSYLNIEVFGFCDNDIGKQKNGFLGKRVYSVTEVTLYFKDKFFILASKKYAANFYQQLISGGTIRRENIWIPRIGSLYATVGKQYFDCPGLMPTGEDVFVDCGCFDGTTSKDFIEWCRGNYKRIIAFEPDEICFNECKKLEAQYDNVKVYNMATYDTKRDLFFNMTGDGGSRNCLAGPQKVQADSIDNILGGNQASFIKLDVEGAEYNTILGAKDTIMKYKPRLAISLYHKPNDIYIIPTLLMQIRDDYKFYIRHYTNCMWETVLYAI